MKQRAEEEEQRAVAAQEVFKFKESELQKKDEDLEVTIWKVWFST